MLRYQSETSSFLQHLGNTQSVCSLIDKGFSPACCCQGKQGEIHSQDFGCPTVPALQLPTCVLSPRSQGSGLAWPQLYPAPQEHFALLDGKGEVYSDCGGAGSEAKRDGKSTMPADFNGKRAWLLF